MLVRSWIDVLKSHFSRTPTRQERRASGQRGPATRRLRLETLEDRCLLAFLPAVSYPAGASPQAIVTADFNGGAADIAVTNYLSSTVSVMLGDGLGGLGAKTDFATGAYPQSLVVGDVSGDGQVDLVTANAADVSILRRDGAGSFAPPDSIGLPGQFPSGYGGTDPLVQSPRSVATGDFNSDGRLDLAVTGLTSFLQRYWGYYGYYYYQVDNAYVNVLISDGSGGFNPAVTTPLSGLYPDSVTVGRFNADANDDLAIANSYYGTVSVLLSDGVGGFSSSADFYTGSPSSVAAGDVNGDLKTDLVAANRYGNDVSVLLGDGLGGFGVQNFAVGSEPTSVVLGDFNHDTKVDIATANFSGNDVSVLYGRGNGTFKAAVNAAATSGAYSIAAGDFNGDGWLDAATANPSGDSASVLLNDQSWPPPPPPSVSINDVTVTEGNTGTVDATFTVSLSFAHDVDVTVHYATANGTATAGSDYTAASGDVIIFAGDTSATFSIAVTGDRLAEPTETFAVNLSAPVNATIGDGQGIGTILDDEPLVSINDVTVTEGNTGSVNATFTVTLSALSDVDVTVHYAAANGTATAGSDYTATSGDVIIPHGQISRTLAVAVTGDRLAEPTETYFVNLTAPVNAGIADGQGVGTILDNEPRLSINNVTKQEGNGNTTQFLFTVTLSAAYDQAVTVNYATANGTATAGSDYQAKNGTLTFAPGVRTMTITIVVYGDKVKEAAETFFVNLSGASSNALISIAQGIGTILDDDIHPKK